MEVDKWIDPEVMPIVEGKPQGRLTKGLGRGEADPGRNHALLSGTACLFAMGAFTGGPKFTEAERRAHPVGPVNGQARARRMHYDLQWPYIEKRWHRLHQVGDAKWTDIRSEADQAAFAEFAPHCGEAFLADEVLDGADHLAKLRC